MDRYTSPALSLALAEAGISQQVRSYGCYYVENEPRETRFGLDAGAPGRAIRALDLTDALHEIEKAIPLSDWGIHTCDAGYACQVWVKKGGTGYLWSPIPDHEASSFDSPVEAAALVLLALLRERRKP